jgi:oligopeptide/dipeptide ABC transporter ATP-binding protein
MSQDLIVEVRNLSVDFETIDGSLKVVRGVSFKVREGEVVGVVGETGCGKSVTAKVLLGILPSPPARIRSGEVHFLGRNLLTIPRTERELLKQKIAYIPQDPTGSLNPVFSIGALMIDMIVWRMSGQSLGTYLRKRRSSPLIAQAENHAAEVLAKLYIPDPRSILRKYPMELSGGMKQRILLAMALSGQPKILIADEPTTALDATTQKRTLHLIREKMEEEKLAGLYITHNLGVARTFCHWTYVMYGGTVVESGITAELLDTPLHPYTKGLVDSIPRLSGRPFGGIDGQIPDYLNPPPGCRFHPRCRERMPVCGQEAPSMVQAGGERWVACWLFGERT